jgi:hypothetical protein
VVITKWVTPSRRSTSQRWATAATKAGIDIVLPLLGSTAASFQDGGYLEPGAQRRRLESTRCTVSSLSCGHRLA